jgi:hypothetical protein
LNRPKDSEVRTLREWIESPHLGGGCGFIGRDLGGFAQPSAYDTRYEGDFVMPVESPGEDDFLSRFLSGPFLKLFHKFWYRHKVCIKWLHDGLERACLSAEYLDASSSRS